MTERHFFLQWSRIYKDAEIPNIDFFIGGGKLTFNGAASIKMRKFSRGQDFNHVDIPLQWSRIYKDAEIYVLILSEESRHYKAFFEHPFES